MKILVCIKQVPEIDPIGAVEPEDVGTFRMNHFDECAVEEALLIREANDGTKVAVITVGPDRTVDVLKRAVGMGADHAIHLSCDAKEDQDPLHTASLIARYAGKNEYDLILAGVMSEDLMRGQVGPMTAALLHRPLVTGVICLTVSSDHRSAVVERETEGGVREILKVRLPALFTLQTGINQPRYPALSSLLRANRTPPETIPVKDSDAPSARQFTVGTTVPQKQRQGRVLEGTAEQKAGELVTVLREKGLLRQVAG